MSNTLVKVEVVKVGGPGSAAMYSSYISPRTTHKTLYFSSLESAQTEVSKLKNAIEVLGILGEYEVFLTELSVKD